jgi:triacylglycerol lipase
MRHAAVAFALALAFATGCSGSPDQAERSDFTTAQSTQQADTYTQTQYPIVLIPGLMGFREILGSIDYFPGVVQAIKEGGGEAFVVTTSQANTSDVRVQQILPQLQKVLAQTGASKANLVGHSQGSIDARLIAAIHPELVASVTSVGGPNLGSPVADFAMSVPLASSAFDGISNLFKMVAGSPYPNDSAATFTQLGVAGMAAFNVKYPAALPTTTCGEGAHVVNGIRYYSWGAVAWLTNAVDLLDPLWLILGPHIIEPNDGLVGRCSSHLGEVLRDNYFQNHIDETNMLLGLVFPLEASPTTLFRTHANRLKNDGL